jgi:hypothetical protein
MEDEVSRRKSNFASRRIQSLQYQPLASENIISPRNQALPSVIRSHSSYGAIRRSSITLSRDGSDESPSGLFRKTSSAESLRDMGRRNSFSTPIPESMLSDRMRSMRLIGHSNPRYQWEKYYKTEAELKAMKKPLRKYYERNNFLITQYLYIDRLLDSSLPHNLIAEYSQVGPSIPHTILEEPPTPTETSGPQPSAAGSSTRVKRTPKTLFKLPEDDTPLLAQDGSKLDIDIESLNSEDIDSDSPVVSVAIAVNFVANTLLLGGKLAVIILSNSLSVLASLVDAVLDFLSTAIVYITTKLISIEDQYKYPIGRRKLEPIGVLVFSVIMITSFFQVALQCLEKLTSDDHEVVQLGIPSIAIMVSTVVIKGICWFWCRLVKNSSVQALAQDAMTDVIFNTFSIIFPLSKLALVPQIKIYSC